MPGASLYIAASSSGLSLSEPNATDFVVCHSTQTVYAQFVYSSLFYYSVISSTQYLLFPVVFHMLLKFNVL